MRFIELLERAVDIPETIRIKFLQQYKVDEKTLHFFFEGQDDESFYVNSLQAQMPSGYTTFHYNCGGKPSLNENYSSINWNIYNKNRCLFFTDKDLDNFIPVNNPVAENVFETEYYSIENYVVTTETFARFARELCCITDSNAIDTLSNKLKEQLPVFHRLTLVYMAWIVYCRRNNYQLNLAEIDIAKLFYIDRNFNIHKSYKVNGMTRFQYITTQSKIFEFDFKTVLNISRTLAGEPHPKSFVRGKYELWFLYAFCKNTVDVAVPKLNETIKQLNITTSKKMPKCKMHVGLTYQNILQLLGPRVKTPESVLYFLNYNFSRLA